MGIGISIVLITAGALMTFAVGAEGAGGFDVDDAGVILMVVGAIGLVVTALIWGPRTRRTVTESDGRGRLTVRDEL